MLNSCYLKMRVGNFSVLNCWSTFYFLLIEFHCTFFHHRYRNNILCSLLFYFLPRGQWMDYRCRLGSLGNSSTASGRCDAGETAGPSYMIGRWDLLFFVPTLLLAIITPLFNPILPFLCLISFWLFLCASVWENTRAWAPHFLWSCCMVLAFFRQCNYKCTMCIPSKKIEIVMHC